MDDELYFSVIDEFLTSEHPVHSLGIILFSPAKRLLSLNATAERIMGVKTDQVWGFKCEEILQCDPCLDECPFDAVWSEGRTMTRHVVLSLAQKGPTSVRLSIAPILASSGVKSGAVGIIHIEPRLDPRLERLEVLAKDSIRDRMKLAAIADSTSQGIFAVDRDFRITFLNRAGQQITGFKEAEVLGKKVCWDVFRSNLCGDNCPMEQTLAENHPVRDVELLIRDRWEEEVPVRVNTTPLLDDEGHFIGAVETFQDLREIKRLSLALERKYSFGNIVGHHRRMEEIFDLVHIATESDVRVLIRGESGTGKELIARAIHYNSHRKDGPIVKVVCGAVPESLLESELFGHAKGAFTGAYRDKRGRLELAEGGTVFLDEVGDITLASQVKLLRFLQEKEFESVGSTITKRVDVRVIAATNKDLEAIVAAGGFREDLYYRLNVFTIFIPPLRERKEDIPALIFHILEQLNKRQPKGVREVSSSALNLIMEHDWPGNVRELENAIEHAYVCTKGPVITPEVLPIYLRERSPVLEESKDSTMHHLMKRRERDLILGHIEGARWNLSEVSKRLGISRTTLWRKMKKHNIVRR
jgi:PAS domain S-box-containing protein